MMDPGFRSKMNSKVGVLPLYSSNEMTSDEMEKRIQELERELSNVNERYQHIFKNAPSGIYEIDFVNQKFISCNEELLHIIGYSRAEFMTLSPLDLMSEESSVRFLERLQALFSGEEVEERPEYLVKAKDGREIWTRLNPTYIYNEGQIVGAHVIVHDISAIKNAEEEVQFTKEKFQNLFQNAQELIAVVQDGEIKVINNDAVLMDGYEKEKVMDSSFLDFIHPDDRDEARERYIRRLAGEDVDGITLIRLRMAGGDHRWVEVKSVLIDWEGNPATINFMTDVDERIRAQQGLVEAEEQYRLVVENTQDAIVVLQDEIIKFMNERTPVLLGLKREEVEFLPFINLVHPDDREKSMKRYMDCLNGAKIPPNQIVRFCHKDESTRYGEVTKISIDWEGTPGVLTFVSDVTDKVNAEKVANLERSKSEFYLDLLGHDIGNLMQGISAWLELAKRNEKVEGQLKYFLDQSWHLSERSKRLVKNVLIISRIRDRDPTFEIIDLKPMIERTIQETIDNFPNKEVEIDFEYDDSQLKILAEPLIEEVFYNIIHNAIKFQMERNPQVRVTCVPESKDRVKIEVSDRGPGIPDQQKIGIFKRFKDITGRKSTGIGLALTKELVDRYNGSIQVEDNMEEGKVVGSKFTVELPSGC